MGKHDGSIINRGKNCWRVFVSGGFDKNRKRIRKSFTVHGSRQDAVKEQRKAQRELLNNGPTSSMRLKDWAKRWMEDMARSRALTTVHLYRRMLANRILPLLGDIRLDQLQPRDIARFKRQLDGDSNQRYKDQKISSHTQLKYFRLVSCMLQAAVYEGLLTVNPAEQVEPPRLERYRARFYESADVQQLWKALQKEPVMWQAITATVLLLGVRRGELVGLQWGDIDFNREEVHIRRAAYFVGGEKQGTKTPKTALSERTIPLPAPLKELLKHWRESQGGGDTDFICAGAPGGWMSVDTPTRWFADFITRHKLPPIGLHGLRHTAATLMIDAGLPIRAVSEHLGHSVAAYPLRPLFAHLL